MVSEQIYSILGFTKEAGCPSHQRSERVGPIDYREDGDKTCPFTRANQVKEITHHETESNSQGRYEERVVPSLHELSGPCRKALLAVLGLFPMHAQIRPRIIGLPATWR